MYLSKICSPPFQVTCAWLNVGNLKCFNAFIQIMEQEWEKRFHIDNGIGVGEACKIGIQMEQEYPFNSGKRHSSCCVKSISTLQLWNLSYQINALLVLLFLANVFILSLIKQEPSYHFQNIWKSPYLFLFHIISIIQSIVMVTV